MGQERFYGVDQDARRRAAEDFVSRTIDRSKVSIAEYNGAVARVMRAVPPYPGVSSTRPRDG